MRRLRRLRRLREEVESEIGELGLDTHPLVKNQIRISVWTLDH